LRELRPTAGRRGNEALTAANSIYSFNSAIRDAEYNAQLTLKDSRIALEIALSLYKSADFKKAALNAQGGVQL